MGHAETFEHTADVGLRAYGQDLPDLFEAAASGLFDAIVANRGDVRAQTHEQIWLEAETLPELFLAWLNELIFRSETSHRVYNWFRVQVEHGEHGARLTAEIAGESIDPIRHILDHEVKAATHHGLAVRACDGCWQAEVILDI
jgi:SHS2 domain-containing protein